MAASVPRPPRSQTGEDVFVPESNTRPRVTLLARVRERPDLCSLLTSPRPSDALRGTSAGDPMQSNNGFLFAAIAVVAIAVLASLLLMGDGRFPFPLWR